MPCYFLTFVRERQREREREEEWFKTFKKIEAFVRFGEVFKLFQAFYLTYLKNMIEKLWVKPPGTPPPL